MTEKKTTINQNIHWTFDNQCDPYEIFRTISVQEALKNDQTVLVSQGWTSDISIVSLFSEEHPVMINSVLFGKGTCLSRSIQPFHFKSGPRIITKDSKKSCHAAWNYALWSLPAIDSTVSIGYTLDGSQDYLNFYCSIFSSSMEHAQEILDELIKIFPRKTVEEEKDDESYVYFWYMSTDGDLRRNIRAFHKFSPWENIQNNYSEKCQTALSSFMKQGEKIEDGQMAIFWGPPGTGKTFFIKSLADEWRDMFEVHYIMDPERFFSHTDYMMAVLTADTELRKGSNPVSGSLAGIEEKMMAFEDSDEFDKQLTEDLEEGSLESLQKERNREVVKKKKLLIFEDSDEFLSKNAKMLVGQSFSRLLNVASGMIGQCIPCILLFTSNEPLSKLHDAVTRAGRCMAKVEFPFLSKEEANKWLKSKDSSVSVDRSSSLAELHDILRAEADKQVNALDHKNLHGEEHDYPTKVVGFGG